VEVEFSTNRAFSPKDSTHIAFNGNRGHLIFGTAIVTVPFKHRVGDVELQPWYDPFSPNKRKYFTIERERILSTANWEAAVRAAAAQGGQNAVLLFVHGYNNSFDDALYRTAQIAYDVRFKGAVAMFSWPSVNSLALYPTDYNNAEWSIDDFKASLKRIIDATHSSQIYIVAHSMGNQVVTRGLIDLAQHDPMVRSRVRELVLAAPDVDAGIFKKDIAPFLDKAAQRTTLYASSRDLALAASQTLQGYVRAGDTSHGVLIVPPIQTVDASRASADLLGHGYVASSAGILNDIRKLISRHWPASQRGLPIRHARDGDYWVYVPSH
jgi:esterase/lipase superfamily enzyme